MTPLELTLLEERPGLPRRWWILGVLGTVAFMIEFELFAVAVAVPSIAGEFTGASLAAVACVLGAYMMVSAALTVPCARLTDRFGLRPMLLAGLAVFLTGSALGGVAPSIPVLVAGRVVQAVGAAVIAPTLLGLLLPSFAKSRRALVISLWAAVTAAATTTGPVIGGLLAAADWRWILLSKLPIGAAMIALGFWCLPQIPRTATRTPRAATLLRDREFTSAAAGLFVHSVSFVAWLLVAVLLLQELWHYGVVRAGLVLTVPALSTALISMNTGRLTGRRGRVLWPVAGLLITAGGWVAALTAVPGDHQSRLSLVLFLASGAAAGLVQAPLLASAPTGTATLNTVRLLGAAVGVTVTAWLLSGSDLSASLTAYRPAMWLPTIASAAGAVLLLALRSSSFHRGPRVKKASITDQ
ncbi:MFS transporter [Actinoplanes palleronii]|uniref:Major facilitator superfamily (MFS) profile domain-containing protein n=1 Tax=Actinoplanes palleronii TaxID=113570 RepID=A0ABQ4B5J5_9ACTN|nr:MFS transporter [Actinoplanes palleronii]GIE65923.1 hypothetical protein Apa02nite_020310 [Actinoplanes palleronii]